MIILLRVFAALMFISPASLAGQAQPAEEVVSLEPGDLLQIAIWREDDLSGEFPVNERGMVTLPLLGEKQVTGVSISTLRDRLIDEYRVQLRNPSIEITPLRRIHVLGEVARPGLYRVDPTISLAGVIALAGGATGAGDLRRIQVIRRGEIIRQRVGADATLHRADIRSDDQILVEPRSWFERNIPFVVGVMFSATGIILQLLR